MRFYQVIDTRPGASVTLMDVLDGSRVTVHEKTGSRQLKRSDLLAARVIRTGASGQPEMEAGLLPISRFILGSVQSQLTEQRDDFRRGDRTASDEEFFKQMPPFFHSAWLVSLLDPPIPRMQNTDGEEMLITRTHFEVRDAEHLALALDGCDELDREEEEAKWSWSGENQEGQVVSLGLLEISGEALLLETNSAERGERGRAMIEQLADAAVAHRATSHEDLTLSLKEALRGGREVDGLPGTGLAASREPRGATPADIPPDVIEDLTLDHYSRHYRGWLDEELPALDGRTPREAAKNPAMKDRLEQLVRDLDGMYLSALRMRDPAYDPSWMRAELGLTDRSRPKHPPPLAHERWAEAMPGWADVCRSVAERVRRRSDFDDASSTAAREDLEVDLSVRRLLKDRPRQTSEAEEVVESGSGAVRDDDRLVDQLRCSVNYELHRRKTFWVDEALTFLLARTDFDVVGGDLRLPFPCFALVFTDRHMLSLAERLLVSEPACPQTGNYLRVATVFVSEERTESGRVLRLGFALDTLGADPPYLYEHEVRLREDVRVELRRATNRHEVVVEGQQGQLPASQPLPSLLQVALNAILYATSAGVEPQVRPRPPVPALAGPAESPVFTSEEVYFLPGKIKITALRQMQDLDRNPSGRQLMHRFMVRGHWRRPAKTWKEQRMRWISPYWKGPDIAAVIERTYKLTT